MDNAHYCSTVNETRRLLKHVGNVEAYKSNLELLRRLVSSTSQSEAVRNDLSQHPSILQLSADALYHAFSPEEIPEQTLDLYIRNVRGLVLFVRNLSVSTFATIDLHRILPGMQNLTNRVDKDNSQFAICFQSYLQLVANVCLKQKSLDQGVVDLLANIFDPSTITSITISSGQDLTTPFNLYVKCFIEGSDLRQNNTQILITIVHYLFEQGLTHIHDATFDPELLLLLQKIITVPIFRIWIGEKSTNSNNKLPEILNLCQLIVSSKDDWISDETQNLAWWIYEIFCKFSEKAIEILPSNLKNVSDLNFTHHCLVRILDMMTEICKFQAVSNFFKNHDTINILIPLLRAVQDNTSTQTLKPSKSDLPSQGSIDAKKRFPLVKSLIIEVITALCCNSRSIQDEVRKSHGLELILSSCVIDDDNPYVKEQAILCLKFLLENNHDNQSFIASLEAREVISQDIISQVGYEVSLEGGKITLKHEKKN